MLPSSSTVSSILRRTALFHPRILPRSVVTSVGPMPSSIPLVATTTTTTPARRASAISSVVHLHHRGGAESHHHHRRQYDECDCDCADASSSTSSSNATIYTTIVAAAFSTPNNVVDAFAAAAIDGDYDDECDECDECDHYRRPSSFRDVVAVRNVARTYEIHARGWTHGVGTEDYDEGELHHRPTERTRYDY